ncbi:cell division protein FtsW [Candidatus Daviesbacteria bacterium RIFCSPHIGHO2_01_FULL_40_11]|uniref:Probable peptidoglycan glycosyltransferase FtsW n=1 Tax=Candidatus Daviesbacteria bacterium RIFCSPHIGHO2_01_FULL_40_11 TaxID=1797762 RepID=A0A1F5JH39_9BACT|nr:MAG: cell division protein FtsW [Candidatus Daviesbacteria bacterium RIFCSPHIGHO2_01_FULL_40_11]OGE62814.1 MAG: cell division protein FtsW [Candidatus Daviesbacteria bacterium RIFCSPLOWO2_01_FULL_40_27]
MIHNRPQKQRIDLPLLLIVAVLVVFGLLMVYDASAIQGLKDFKDSLYYIRLQTIWVAVGVLSMIFFASFDYKKFRILSVPLLLFSLLFLLAVFIPGLGVSGGGAHRWLKFGMVTIQPAEIIKLTGVIYLASVFEKKVRLVPFLILITGVTLITAVLQRDLGSSVVFVATALVLYFASGGSVWHFIIAIPVGVLASLLLIFTSGYRSKRILALLDPFSDPQGFTYHISQVLIALGSGGLFGLGLGHSRQKFEYIPEVTTDSIFGIIGEELGFVGGSLVIVIFALILIRGFKIASNCQDNFGKILALGLTSWLGIQAIINLSSMTALLPLTGVPLPFISYGGSALVANLTAVGILLNISKQTT